MEATLINKLISVLESCVTVEQVDTLDAWFDSVVKVKLDIADEKFYYRARSLKVARLRHGH